MIFITFFFLQAASFEIEIFSFKKIKKKFVIKFVSNLMYLECF